ncbi:protein-export chaperone SecB [Fodinicurvata halophila]|uniref:Protein-export protein SecB n=1 Tax=Fodinicurvata halophila TaxID=1419723 RepID=A0ABV8UNN4_9PROT
MNDTTPGTTPGASPAGANPQDQQQGGREAPVTVHVQYLKDLSFESPNAPTILTNTGQSPNLDIQLNVGARPLQDRIYEVVLNLKVTAKQKTEQEERTAFMVELEYAGVVTVGQVVPDERVEQVLLIDCAAMLFPFARRAVADTTREGGFPPVLINPVDFVQLYRQRKAREAAASGDGQEGNGASTGNGENQQS